MQIPQAVIAVVREYQRLLEAQFGERLIALRVFGSYARGDADDDSDIDVAVVVKDLNESERTCAIDLAVSAWKTNPTIGPLSPLVWSDAEHEDRVRSERRIARDVADGIAL